MAGMIGEIDPLFLHGLDALPRPVHGRDGASEQRDEACGQRDQKVLQKIIGAQICQPPLVFLMFPPGSGSLFYRNQPDLRRVAPPTPMQI